MRLCPVLRALAIAVTMTTGCVDDRSDTTSSTTPAARQEHERDIARRFAEEQKTYLARGRTPTRTIATHRGVQLPGKPCPSSFALTLTDVDLRMEGCEGGRAKLWLGHISRIERRTGVEGNEKVVRVEWHTLAGQRDADELTFPDPSAAASFESTAVQALSAWRAQFSLNAEGFRRWRESMSQ